MTERDRPFIPDAVHEAAGDWFGKMQGKPDPAVERAFQVWIGADFRHRIAYDQAMRDWQDSHGLTKSDIGRTRKLERAPFLMRRNTHLAAAGLGLAVILGAGTIGLARYGLPFALVPSAEAATFRTSVGEIRTFRLADGSQVTLDTNTLIHVHFSASRRRISLERGRARFQVSPDENRPFAVTVPDGSEVTGSGLFDVSAFDEQPTAAVFTGSVQLKNTDAARSPISRTLAAGQSDALDSLSPPAAVTAAQTRWVAGMLALDAAPLAQAIAMINRYNRVQIRLDNPALGVLCVTGAFQSRDPQGFARAVAATFHLEIDTNDPGMIVLRANRMDQQAPR